MGNMLNEKIMVDRLREMSNDELVEYILNYWSHDHDPTVTWFIDTHCKKCPSEEMECDGRMQKCAWCELHHKCKFYPDLEEIPSCKQVIKMWLENKI